MLDRKVALDRIKSSGVMAVLRRTELDQVRPVIDALLAGGLDCIELPIATHAGLLALPRVHEEYGEQICLGAGSVFNADLATLAAGLDVDFISAPSSDMAIVEVCKARDVVSFPGAMTPTEIIRAWHVGADLIKVFPSGLLGPQYFSSMLMQLPGLPLVAAGGVNEENLGAFLQAGALTAVVGRGLLGEAPVGGDDYAALTERARRLREIVSGSK
jgi:2-dehydro-3-deoxyphosphogluconate aldolase/(4S)-4-hydroxy-2-oxoglutarate aldolase